MFTWRVLRLLVVVILSSASGWMLNDYFNTSDNISALPTVTLSSPLQASIPSITLFNDGTVTIDVKKRPLKWVFEEIARQGGQHASIPSSAPNEKTADTLAPSIIVAVNTQSTENERAEILRTVSDVDENKRYEGLLFAKSSGTALPEDTLKNLVNTDASERVRLLAFDNYLEAKSGSPTETRTALQTALSNTSGKIQAEAKQLLDQLDQLEQIDADATQNSTQ